ncbi:MAG: glycosyltransferase family 39 protein [Gammaproteobacteria bacterium]|nr:glycosyltransferase family 39 protein [Gammaproteobacteria bacterium]
MQQFSLSSKSRKYLWQILFFIFIARLFTMFVLPLIDTTEARYGEMARKMLETGNWITPLHDYGVPFWAKPPLSIWGSAISMKIFGINEFAARLPSLFFMLGNLVLIWHLCKSRYNKDFALLNITILFALPLFFVSAGAVMTDAGLAFSVCLVFAGFWLATNEKDKNRQKLFGYLFFVGLGLGLLAKGPISWILTLPPILIWQFRHNKLSSLKNLPWLSGCLLILLIAAPWYILAELKTPGFLNYFIVGEHLKRFLVPGWSGDLYGHPHRQPLGMIWIFMIISTFPWVLFLAHMLLRNYKKSFYVISHNYKDSWLCYLFYWSLWPLVFFTFARNIIFPYVITALPPFVLLVSELWTRSSQSIDKINFKHWLTIPLLLPVSCILLWICLLTYNPYFNNIIGPYKITQKYMNLRESKESEFYFYCNRSYSAQFYSHGKAKNTKDLKELEKLFSNNTEDFIVVKNKKMHLINSISKNFIVVADIGGYSLLKEIKIKSK